MAETPHHAKRVMIKMHRLTSSILLTFLITLAPSTAKPHPSHDQTADLPVLTLRDVSGLNETARPVPDPFVVTDEGMYEFTASNYRPPYYAFDAVYEK